MSEDNDNRKSINNAVRKARRRWLVSMVVNAGGRWAVLPACVGALAGMALALTGAGLPWLMHTVGLVAFVALGLGGVLFALGLTCLAYMVPGVRGAPDYTLLLDRALGLDDALPTWLEKQGEFSNALETRVAKGLDPVREKRATPARRWGAVMIALLLALMPLLFLRPKPESEPPEQVAKQPETPPPAAPNGDPGSNGGGGASEGDQSGNDQGESESKSGRGEEGEVKRRPDEASGEGDGAPPPEGELPRSENNAPRPPREGNVGDNEQPPNDRPERKAPDLENNFENVRPDAGEGETRSEDRSRWVYDPDGEKRDDAPPRPRDVKHPGEKSVPRTKITSSERRTIRQIFKKLYE